MKKKKLFKISEMWCWEFFFFILPFFLTSEITWKNLILIWNVNYLMLLILVFSVFELKYLLEMCNLTYLTMNVLLSEKSSAFWRQNLQLKQLYFFFFISTNNTSNVYKYQPMEWKHISISQKSLFACLKA